MLSQPRTFTALLTLSSTNDGTFFEFKTCRRRRRQEDIFTSHLEDVMVQHSTLPIFRQRVQSN